MFAKLAVLALALAASGCADARPKDAAVRLDFDGGVCSGTAVGESIILTAEHCWQAGRLRMVNGFPAHALEIVKDGKDHVLVRVTVTFRKWARMGPQAQQGDRLRWFGNPAGQSDVYREGYVARTDDKEIWLDARGFGGDSGSGLFDSAGRVTGVLTGVKSWANPSGLRFDMIVVYPLAFTAEQWREIRA